MMSKQENEYVDIQLDYVYIAENYEKIIIDTYKNGDLTPTMFDDVHTAYPGNPLNDIKLPEIDDNIEEEIKNKKQERKVVEIKHFSRNLNHNAWFKHLEDEVYEFIKKYPQYSDVIH